MATRCQCYQSLAKTNVQCPFKAKKDSRYCGIHQTCHTDKIRFVDNLEPQTLTSEGLQRKQEKQTHRSGEETKTSVGGEAKRELDRKQKQESERKQKQELEHHSPKKIYIKRITPPPPREQKQESERKQKTRIGEETETGARKKTETRIREETETRIETVRL